MNTESKASWISLLGWLLLIVFVGYTMYQTGRASEKVASLEERLDDAKKELATAQDQSVSQDSTIAVLRQEAANAKAKVVYVDKVVTPSIDSAITVITAQLDSAGKTALAKVIDGYEAKLAVRDAEIERLEQLVAGQDKLVELQRVIIGIQTQMDSTRSEMTKELAKLAKPGIFKRLLDALPVAALVLIVKG